MRQFLSLRCFAQTSKNSSENQPLEQSSCKFPLESLKTAEIWSRFKATPLAVLDLHLRLMKTLFALITLHLHNHLGQMIVGSRFLAWNVQVERILLSFFWKSFLWIEIPFGRGSLEEVPQRLLWVWLPWKNFLLGGFLRRFSSRRNVMENIVKLSWEEPLMKWRDAQRRRNAKGNESLRFVHSSNVWTGCGLHACKFYHKPQFLSYNVSLSAAPEVSLWYRNFDWEFYCETFVVRVSLWEFQVVVQVVPICSFCRGSRTKLRWKSHCL